MEMHTARSLREIHGIEIEPRPARTLGQRVHALLDWVAERERDYRDGQRLLEMTDRELADIGLTRADVLYHRGRRLRRLARGW